MDLTASYRLSQYQDLGPVDNHENVHLVRGRTDGKIGVQKRIALRSEAVYEFLLALDSPYLPQIYELIRTDDAIIVIEEYIIGKTIEEVLLERVIGEEEACGILLQLCEALQPLHEAKPPVICRDLKPENVMLSDDGRVRIVDFNIARIYEEGKHKDTQLLGTREYAAPEQFGYAQTDARTDIYALGVFLNYMLLHVFPAERTADGPIGEIIRKCIRMDPAQRYQSVRELSADVRRIGQSGKRKRGRPGSAALRSSDSPENEDKGERMTAFLLPGFRSRRPGKMIAAALGYGILTWYCFTLTLTDGTGELLSPGLLLLNRAMFWLSQMLFILLLFNYRGIRQRLPLLRSSRKWVRGAGYVVSWFLLFFLFIVLAVAAEDLFF